VVACHNHRKYSFDRKQKVFFRGNPSRQSVCSPLFVCVSVFGNTVCYTQMVQRLQIQAPQNFWLHLLGVVYWHDHNRYTHDSPYEYVESSKKGEHPKHKISGTHKQGAVFCLHLNSALKLLSYFIHILRLLWDPVWKLCLPGKFQSPIQTAPTHQLPNLWHTTAPVDSNCQAWQFLWIRHTPKSRQ
jgi:hypothetical protein